MKQTPEAQAFSQGSPPPLHAVPPPPEEGSRWDGRVQALLNPVANSVVRKPRGERLRFRRVRTAEELAAVGRLRLKVYREKLPYLLKELSEDGTDAYDAHSFVFAAWRGEQVVASIRATRYPFETLKYVPEATLGGWLGEGWERLSLEWGRLVADTPPGFGRLTPALLSYAGPYLGCVTPYRTCFGYTRLETRRTFSGFWGDRGDFRFKIPDRGDHDYALSKTDFVSGSLMALPRWLGSMALGMVKKREPSRT